MRDDGAEPPPENVIRMEAKKKRVKFRPDLLEVGRILREEEELGAGTMFKLDLFSGETLLMRPVPRPGVKRTVKHEPRPTTDVDITHLIEWLIANGATKTVSPGVVDRAVQAEGERNAYSSAREALDTLPAWDGVYRLEKFWIDVCGAQAAEEGMDDLEIMRQTRYLHATAECFFTSIVARILRPGCKVDTMVVLEGPQGTLKSTLLRVLAFDRDEWFSDSMVADLKNKDARQHLGGKLIIEMAELAQFQSSRVENLKAFISAQDDKYRPSYGRRDVIHKRQCVFVGTTNSDDYLSDVTGNRRFWPIRCGEIDIAKARELMPQLYAEAIKRFIDKKPWWLPRDIELLAEAEQRARLTNDPWEGAAREAIDRFRREAIAKELQVFWVTTTDVLETIQAKRETWDRGMEMRAGMLLTKLGGKNRQLPRPDKRWPRRGFRFEIRA
jgi:predicted P-loop ATPase